MTVKRRFTPSPNLQAEGPELARGSNWVAYEFTQNGKQYYNIKGLNVATAYGDEGNVIDGGPGNDLIRAGSGTALVHGGADEDDIMGLSGNDILWGDGFTLADTTLDIHGNDTLDGGRVWNVRMLYGQNRPAANHSVWRNSA